MKRIVIGIIVCLLFANCIKKEKIAPKRNSYIISYEDKKLQNYYDSIDKKSKIKPPPPPQKIFYSDNQLIIDKNNNLYFYQKEFIQILCSYGHENDTIPDFLGIKPKDIIKIPQNSLIDFLNENILSKEKGRQILIIASQNDTIKNTAFLDFLKHNKIPTYLIRRTTQEEDTVLHYKKTEKYYYSDEIKWDKTKINFSFKSN
ncbi:hypothetical protein ABS764_10640 [Flavobacterium sp. ST-87]|uniref:Lipoprotein n=1 Tax=Flavobacterium plantiphilum TaxID=3163297 RepID=A0ABW8XVY1_9FLAO